MIPQTSFFDVNSSEETMKKAFEYIKFHRNSLFFSILYLVMPIIAVNVIIYYFLLMNGLMNNFASSSMDDAMSIFTSFLGLALVGFLSASMLFSTVFIHIKISYEKGFYALITVGDVWERFKKEALRIMVNYFIMFIFNAFVFWVSLLILFFLVGIVSAFFASLSFVVFSIIGGIFYTIIFFLGICLITGLIFLNAFMIVFEKENSIQLFGQALKMIFKTKSNFWQTVWTSFVSLICIYTFLSLFYIPFALLMYFGTFTSQFGNIMLLSKYIGIISIIYMIIVPFVTSVGLVQCGFLYFSLNERMNHANLLIEIEQIGKNEEKDTFYDFS